MLETYRKVKIQIVFYFFFALEYSEHLNSDGKPVPWPFISGTYCVLSGVLSGVQCRGGPENGGGKHRC